MAFLVGATESGEAVKRVVSMTQYEAEFGQRTGFVDAYDAAETFYREGGSALTVARTNAGAAADIPAALAALTKAYGPGQIFVPGASGVLSTTHDALIAHAAENNRIALLDTDPDATAIELTTLGGTLSDDANARYAALFAPAAIVPGLTSADTRTVPYSALEAGIMSRNAAAFTPNVPAAGINGISRFATDLTATFTDAEREDLNDAGVDVARLVYGQVETYGYRTLAPVDSGWSNLGNARLNMEIVAKAEAIGERYMFAQLDGRGIKISQFGAELSGMLVPYYDAGSLYGESAHDAFFVDVGPAVNTAETIANGELHAVVGARMSPFAEFVVIEIVKVATDQPLAVIA
jgi:hypothetical protein